MAIIQKSFWTIAKEWALVTLGILIYVTGWALFLMPNNLVGGGVSGISSMIQYATGGAIQMGYSYFVLNAILIILAMVVIGMGFGAKTIYAIILASVGLRFLPDLIPTEIIQTLALQNGKLMSTLCGGLMAGIGIGMSISNGGSTGGTDIIALMVNKYWPVSLSTVFLLSDVVICALLLLLPEKNFSDMCYGLVEVVIFSIVIDIVVGGKRSSYQLMVFSEKFDSIADHIIHNMDRGVTVLKAQGWYTKSDKNVLLILINQRQLSDLSRVIKEIDPRAFMSISPTHNVYGEGFEEIKTGVPIKKKKKNDTA